MAKQKRRETSPVPPQVEPEADAKDSVVSGTKQGSKVGENEAVEASAIARYTAPFKDRSINCERRGGGKPCLIFTHGAGGGLATASMKEFADGFAEKASMVAFQGSMNLQSRTQMFHSVIELEDFESALGGRSMGARAATMAASQPDRETKALVLVSFPLVGGKKGESREQILLDLQDDVEVIFIVGNRDAQCNLGQLREVRDRMKARTWLVEVNGADHSMGWNDKASVQSMRKKTGVLAAEWLARRDKTRPYCYVSFDDETGKVVHSGWTYDPRDF